MQLADLSASGSSSNGLLIDLVSGHSTVIVPRRGCVERLAIGLMIFHRVAATAAASRRDGNEFPTRVLFFSRGLNMALGLAAVAPF